MVNVRFCFAFIHNFTMLYECMNVLYEYYMNVCMVRPLTMVYLFPDLI